MGRAANTHTTIQPEHTVTDQYNGMHFKDFIKTFKDFKVMYPCKDDKMQFLIELQQKNCVITCEMVNNICVNGYVFKNK
ncbi:MAG: hypothetical protein LBV71_04975 [Prevotella sp.]|jgi:hypothetical protein|nr:hypothetical protein [Prevotella sp.]